MTPGISEKCVGCSEEVASTQEACSYCTRLKGDERGNKRKKRGEQREVRGGESSGERKRRGRE